MIRNVNPPLADSSSAVSLLRVPVKPPVHLDRGWFHWLEGPVFDQLRPGSLDADLTAHGNGEPIGTKIIVHGRITDSDGNAVRHTLVEIWQCNAAGGYIDSLDQSGFPLDPNFFGAGRCVTDHNGYYRFTTIRPGPYPAMFRDGGRAWRASHIHFSLFGPSASSRLITQMYFEGDTLIQHDRLINSISCPLGRDALIAKLDIENTVSESFGPARTKPTLDGSGVLVQPPVRTDPNALLPRNPSALAYRFDIRLRGPRGTHFE